MVTIFGLFPNYDDADAVVNGLLDDGFDPEEINVIVLETVAKNALDERNLQKIKVEKTDAVGSQKVFGLAKMIGGQQPTRINEVGPVYAVGSLASVLARTAAVSDSDIGGLGATLVDFDLPTSAAQNYLQGVKNGDFLLFVRAQDEEAPTVKQVMKANNGRGLAA